MAERKKKETKKKKPVYKIATEDLYLDGRVAYKKGERVAADTAEKRGWGDKVVGEKTKAAKEAHEEADEEKPMGSGNVIISTALLPHEDEEHPEDVHEDKEE